MKELGLFRDDISKLRSEHSKGKPKIRRTVSLGAVKRNQDSVTFYTEKRRSRRLASRQIVQFSDE